ncbi:MAG: hypothetical protein COB46_05515 [Rhodospirillaceae bacterium]|nr:MAG: hypothetical protein COB46_05515 [Rhodospirillaceae bacterium]
MSLQRVIAVVPVRMGSSRLPGKTLMPIAGKPMLGHLLDRLKLAEGIDAIVVATPDSPDNDVVEAYTKSQNVSCFRGDEDDVLSRLLGALESEKADVGVVAFGDAPLVDPKIIDEIIGRFLKDGGYDFLGNDLTTTYPPGMEVEVFKLSALQDSDTRTQDPRIREHGTLFIRQHPDLYTVQNVEAPALLNRPELEIEVDTNEDMDVITAIVEHFSGRMDYSLAEIISFLDASPDLVEKNTHIERRWREFRA